MNDQIIKLAKEGLKRTEIAKKLGISKMQVLAVLCSIPSFYVLNEWDKNIEELIIAERIEEKKRIELEQEQIFEIVKSFRDQGKTFREITNYLNSNGFRNSLRGRITTNVAKKIMRKVAEKLGKTG